MQTHKILIVDDEFEHLDAIVEILERIDIPCRILQAFTGANAYKIAEIEIPDLIITDWEMPGMNGIELIEKLKSNAKTSDIPIIMCSGVMTSSENLDTALQAGAVDYIRKPIDKIELIARTKANLHLADSYQKIKKLNESKDRFFSILAHDLKSPVGNIKTLLDLIVTKPSGFDQEELVTSLSLLQKQSTAAYNILENLLAWANSHRNNVEFNPSIQKVDLAIVNNIHLLESVADKKNINISYQENDQLIATFDRVLISIVIRNLLANAIKFTPIHGKIKINVEQDKYQTLISIIDNGVGIGSDRTEKLFDESVFEPTFGTDREKGSGLGLKLCKYFVEQHNGKIWVESELGKGSKFTFSIPIKLQ